MTGLKSLSKSKILQIEFLKTLILAIYKGFIRDVLCVKHKDTGKLKWNGRIQFLR